MFYELKNDLLTVTVAAMGAELQSIRHSDGTEFLWQGDPAYWADRAPNIFPFVGRLTEGIYQMDGQQHPLTIHGFASHQVFVPEEQKPTRLVLALVDNEETYAIYPRHFCFRITYTLEGDTLGIGFTVENRDEKTMYFGIGGHPGFRVPMSGNGNFTDYRLRFSAPCDPHRMVFTPYHFWSETDIPYELENGTTIPLAHNLFDNDAIVLKDMANTVTLESPSDPHSITVSYPQMTYVGFWHRNCSDAPYVCIEPWSSLPASQDKLTVFEEKKDLVKLPAGETYENLWSITAK